MNFGAEKKEKLKDRVLSRVNVHKATKCWVWYGAVTYNHLQPNRTYGYMMVEGRRVNVRRLTYYLYGKRPALGGYIVTSTCGNSLCVNPDHLERRERKKSTGNTVSY